MKKLWNALTDFVKSMTRITNAYAERLEVNVELERKLIPLADQAVTLVSKFAPIYEAINRNADVLMPEIIKTIDEVAPAVIEQIKSDLKDLRKEAREATED